MVVLHLVGLDQHVGHPVLVVLLVQLVGGALHAEQERNRGVLDRLAVGPGDRLHAGDAGHAEDGFGDLVDHQEVRRVAQVVVAFDHQQFGVHPRGVEVPVGDGVADVGRACRRAGSGARRSRSCSPPGRAVRPATARIVATRIGPGHRTTTTPIRRQPRELIARFGSNRPNRLPMTITAGPSVSAAMTATRMPTAHGTAIVWNHGSRVNLQAQQRARDGEARAQHHVGGAVKHGVVRGFPVLAVSPRLLIPADEEDRVVGARGDRDEGQQARRERRQADDARVAEERDDSPGGAEFDEHHQQDQHHGGDRAVDDQQHDRDDDERDDRGLGRALVAGDTLVGVERRSAGDVGLHPVRRRRLVDDLAHGGDGLVGHRLAHVAAQIDLHVGGLAVGALCAGCGQRITPEVRDVLDVLRCRPRSFLISSS